MSAARSGCVAPIPRACVPGPASRWIWRGLALCGIGLALGCGNGDVYLGSDLALGAAGSAGAGASGSSAGAGTSGSAAAGSGGAAGASTTPGGSGFPGNDDNAQDPTPGNDNAMCAAGTGDCDGVASNGCETDLLTSIDHCGGCGSACPRLPETLGSSCMDGRCVPICEPTHEDCDGDPSNGCEAHLLIDSNNCGACGVVCSCNLGTCM